MDKDRDKDTVRDMGTDRNFDQRELRSESYNQCLFCDGAKIQDMLGLLESLGIPAHCHMAPAHIDKAA